MKSFIAIAAVLCAVAVASVQSSAYGPAPMAPAYKMSGPPCPKSVVVGCAPLVQSVPCKGGASAGGYQGGYSEYAPQYAAPAAEYAQAASAYSPYYVAAPQY